MLNTTGRADVCNKLLVMILMISSFRLYNELLSLSGQYRQWRNRCMLGAGNMPYRNQRLQLSMLAIGRWNEYRFYFLIMTWINLQTMTGILQLAVISSAIGNDQERLFRLSDLIFC